MNLRILLLLSLLLPVAPALAGVPASPATPLAIGDTFTIASEALGEVRRINVYRAPGYGEDPDAPLPVLYMPDGGLGEDFLHVAGLVQVHLPEPRLPGVAIEVLDEGVRGERLRDILRAVVPHPERSGTADGLHPVARPQVIDEGLARGRAVRPSWHRA